MSSGLTAKFALRANLAVSLDEGFGGLGTGAPVPRPPNPSSRLTAKFALRANLAVKPLDISDGIYAPHDGVPKTLPLKAATRANPFQRRRVASQMKPTQECHPERERRISRPTEILRSR